MSRATTLQGESVDFKFDIVNTQTSQHMVQITIPKKHINMLYHQTLLAQRDEADTYGFNKGDIPLYYIENNYQPNILEHLKELFFTHCIINFLYCSLCSNKIVIAGEPILVDIFLKPEQEAKFCFKLSKINYDWDERWKKVQVKAPERKNYKDIDRQVIFFIKEETQFQEESKNQGINIGDWVCFEMELIDVQGSPLLSGYKDILWVKISDEEPDKELYKLFTGKKAGDAFITKSSYFQNYISNEFNISYNFSINIKNYVPYTYFSLDLFKKHFNLKNEKELHQKLIEVFSFRNDISQRRETAEIVLKTLLKQYYLPISSSLLERQKQIVLNAVHANPDYPVYKAQNDFKEKVHLLAEKQLKENLLVDTIAYRENIKVSEKDVLCYLNLMNRARTREFVYFKIPPTKFNGQEIPVSSEALKKYCLREKTLNYLINFLTKKPK